MAHCNCTAPIEEQQIIDVKYTQLKKSSLILPHIIREGERSLKSQTEHKNLRCTALKLVIVYNIATTS